jgi:hypothetical protein
VPAILKRKIVLAVAAVALVACAGGAYAATQNSGSNPRQAFLNDAAKRLGVTPQKLQSALGAAAIDQLSAAVKAGRLTQAQADAIQKRIQSGKPPLRPFFGWHRFGPGGPGFGAGAGPALMFAPGPGPLGAAAKYLGLTNAQLFRQLAAGKSLAQLAKAHGKSLSGLKSAMISDLKAKLDKAVDAKMLTSAQEQRILSRISSRIDEKINQTGFGPRIRRFGENHPRLFPGGPRLFPGAAKAAPGAMALPGPPPPVAY